MPPRDPGKSQLDFPLLIADLIRELRLLGAPIGLLDFNPSVQPVYIVSARGGALDVLASQPVFESSEIFSDTVSSPLVDAVLADTGQLPAGTYDIQAFMSRSASGAAGGNRIIEFQHRNAANAANLSAIGTGVMSDVTMFDTVNRSFQFATVLALDERIRFQNLLGTTPGQVTTTIMVSRRVVP